MKTRKMSMVWVFVLTVCGLGLLFHNVNAEESGGSASQQALRAKATKLHQQKNWKESYETYRQFLFGEYDDERLVFQDFQMAMSCLQQLRLQKDHDGLREELVKAHPENWRALQAVADSYRSDQHHGFIISGEFERGQHRGGGTQANVFERDRVRAMQLFEEARVLVESEKDKRAAAQFYLHYADAMIQMRGHQGAWKLQVLTDISELPDVEEGYPHGVYYGRGGGNPGAPVDEAGNPTLYPVPETYAQAVNDGERWRWLLAQAVEVDPSRKQAALSRWADFLWQQFGVQTLADYGWWFHRARPVDEEKSDRDSSGTWELHTLAGDQTLARLASGIHKLELDPDYQFIAHYKELKNYQRLAEIYENRRQYPEAAQWWRKSIKEQGGSDWKKQRLAQITDKWGIFEPRTTQPAGQGATIDYKFRNGKQVTFTAHAIKVDLLLEDMKDYLKSDPVRIEWQKTNIDQIGHRLVNENQKKYLGKKAAQWTLDLDPMPNHWDRRITVTTPLQQPGAYLLKAQMKDGSETRAVLWVADTVIVKKRLATNQADATGPAYFYIADAISGKPIAKANVEFFGWWGERAKVRIGKRYQHIKTTRFARLTDADGQVIPATDDLIPNNQNRPQYLITATTEDGRFAYHGFTGVWRNNYHDREYNQTKTFGITDRPVYRPGHTVQFKAWQRVAQYDMKDESRFAGQSLHVRIFDPQGKEVLGKTLTLDEYGGLAGDYVLPQNAPLGVYRLHTNHGSITFRVEEYKKPEFEVKIEAPDKPVMLGEKIEVGVEAKYYFGAPVTKGTMKVKVTRVKHDARWYPVFPWDWFYGPGYWWFVEDYSWYPGWRHWGCARPHPMWWTPPHAPPEVVMDAEYELNEEGKVLLTLDTALAKMMHGDSDHKYSITAEVTDESRRTIVGSGKVLVARRPFKVTTWVNRGYYRVGDTIQASFAANTLDQKPVEGKGKLRLYRVSYDKDRQPVEKAVQEWELSTDVEGRAQLQIKASRPGQYRLSYTLNDGEGHEVEGGYVFVVRGQGFDGREYRFNHLELVTDKAEYAPGDKVNLMINTDRPGVTVLLFLRPANGVYLAPQVLRLEGKSTVQEVAIIKKDMPNFFIEALTVYDGQVHSAAREVVVPPEKRILKVEVEPSREEYLPGEKATVKLRLTGLDGKPFKGTTVLSVYDRAVEYISGGSNVGNIKEFFWKWRRHHNPQTEHSLNRGGGHVNKNNETVLRAIGVFGHSVADDSVLLEADAFGGGGGGGMPGSGMMMKSGARREMATAGAPMATLAMADAAPMEANSLHDALGEDKEGEVGQAPAGVEPHVRTQFADTAFWTGALNTDAHGVAEISFDMPENLSGWKLRCWGMGHGTRVGEGDAAVVTKKNLMLRLQAPRFFVEKDEVVLSANIHNYLETDKEVSAVLELDGPSLEILGEGTQKVTIKAGGERRVDWRVKVLREGEAVVRMKALTDEESDAMQVSYPVYVHGMLKTDSFSAVIRSDAKEATIEFEVPAERRMDQSRLEIRYSPTLAGAMLDALPYLAEYPYGCTEQTLSRFLPAVLTRKVLEDMGVNLAAIEEKESNLNAQEIGDDRERAKQWKRWDRNPVFDRETLDDMVDEGLKTLYDMQLSDGGWGWFSGWGERSSPHTTAYVVHGLQLAKQSGLAVAPNVLQRGVAWLKRYEAEQVRYIKNPKKGKNHADNMDAFIYMVLADAAEENAAMRKFLYRDRGNLAVYAKAAFGIALDVQKHIEERDMIVRNIDQFVVEDAENQSAWLELGNGSYWWYWYGSEYEAHAYYLKLLARTQPESTRAAGLVKYLLNNRKHATYWKSTRDTAICLEAFAEYLNATGEHKPDMTVEILIDGKKHKEVKINADNLFHFDNKLILEGDAVESGKHTITLRRTGTGPLYANAYLTNFTLEDYIKRAGLEVKVNRRYFKLLEVEKEIDVRGSRGQAVGQKVEKYERVLLEDLATLKSGELVEVELEIESKNDYEYLIFEDMKPAGFEPVEVRSGYMRKGLRAYVEYRDERVAFFVQRLARGRHSVAYRMRAEIPGRFSALPTRAHAMYAPELKANSDEIKLKIED